VCLIKQYLGHRRAFASVSPFRPLFLGPISINAVNNNPGSIHSDFSEEKGTQDQGFSILSKGHSWGQEPMHFPYPPLLPEKPQLFLCLYVNGGKQHLQVDTGLWNTRW